VVTTVSLFHMPMVLDVVIAVLLVLNASVVPLQPTVWGWRHRRQVQYISHPTVSILYF